MQKNHLYNKHFTLISEEYIDIQIPDNITRYQGELSKIVNKIEKKQLDTDQMYNGHIIIWSNNLTKGVYKHLFSRIGTLNFDNNKVYVSSATHHGEYLKCTVDSDYIICNSFMLPLIAAESRTAATRYGNIVLHRGILTNLNTKTVV